MTGPKFVVCLIGIAICGMGCIWALNTLFATSIAYTLLNWAAMVCLIASVKLL